MKERIPQGRVKVQLLLENLGQALRHYRIAKNLSQQQLAKLAGVSCATVSTIERSAQDPRWGSVVLLAKALGLDLNLLTISTYL